MLWRETWRDKRRERGEYRKGGIMKERKEMEKGGGGGGGASCAKYLTLCVDLPKVRVVLGAYGFSHAGVLLSTAGRRHSHKERGPPSPFPSLLLTPPLKLVPPPSSSLFLPCPPPSLVEQECNTAGESKKTEKERDFRKESRGELVEEGPQTG